MAETKDPLLLASPTAQRELFERFCRDASGFPTDLVIGAAANVLINAIRQSQTTRQNAEIRFDELFGQMKSVLVDHYDSVGRKRGVFPFPQVIDMALFDARRRGNQDG
jgi:hypothetical protein